jgi:hypothetical protein
MLWYQTQQMVRDATAFFHKNIPLSTYELTLSHQPPPPPTVDLNSVVWPDTDTQTAGIVLASSPPPVSVSAAHSLTLTPLGLYDQPCRASAFVLLFHEL